MAYIPANQIISYRLSPIKQQYAALQALFWSYGLLMADLLCAPLESVALGEVSLRFIDHLYITVIGSLQGPHITAYRYTLERL